MSEPDWGMSLYASPAAMWKAKADRFEQQNADMLAALKDTCRILEAVGYTTVFSMSQKERIIRARATLKASMDSSSQARTTNT